MTKQELMLNVTFDLFEKIKRMLKDKSRELEAYSTMDAYYKIDEMLTGIDVWGKWAEYNKEYGGKIDPGVWADVRGNDNITIQFHISDFTNDTDGNHLNNLDKDVHISISATSSNSICDCLINELNEYTKPVLEEIIGIKGKNESTANSIEKTLNSIDGALDNILSAIDSAVETSGIDFISDDYINWSYNENKTARGKGWTIAIPDGFEKIETDDIDPVTGEKRIFELVPSEYKDEKNLENIPIIVMPGAEQNGLGIDDIWMVHPNARAGTAGLICAKMAGISSALFNEAPELFSVGWSDVAAYGMIIETSGWSYSYQITVLTEKRNYLLRVQTQAISHEQKRAFNETIINWLKTMQFDSPNSACPVSTKLESNECCEALINHGNIKLFEEAVEQAQTEYKAAFVGRKQLVETMGVEMIPAKMVAEYARTTFSSILSDAMEVKEFYLEKADNLIKKLQNANADTDVLLKVLKKLHDLDTDYDQVKVDGQIIEVKVNDRITEIRNFWKELERNLKSIHEEAKKADRQLRKKKGEEYIKAVEEIISKRKKELEERKKQIIKEFEDASGVELKRLEDSIKNNEREIVNKKTELNNCGIFAFARKNQLQQEIESAEKLKVENENKLEELRKKNEQELKDKLETSIASLATEISEQYPLPKRSEDMIIHSGVMPTKSVNASYNKLIIEVLRYTDRDITITEIMEKDSRLSELSKPKVTALIRNLIEEGIVRKSLDGKKSCFNLAIPYELACWEYPFD